MGGHYPVRPWANPGRSKVTRHRMDGDGVVGSVAPVSVACGGP